LLEPVAAVLVFFGRAVEVPPEDLHGGAVRTRSRRCEHLERERWTAQAELMRRALAGLMLQRSAIIVGAVG